MQLRRCCRLAGGGGLLRSWRPGYVPSRRASTSDGVGAAVDALVTVASDAPPLTYSMSHGAMFVVEQVAASSLSTSLSLTTYVLL